jgi:hypothetical protein
VKSLIHRSALLRGARSEFCARYRGHVRVKVSRCGGPGGCLPVLWRSSAAGEIATEVSQVFLSSMFFGHGGLAGENQLRDVSEGDGVTAGDAFAGELSDEIAEEEIDLVRGGEADNVGEKFCSKDFGIHGGNGCFEAAGVVRAKCGPPGTVRGAMIFVNQHVTAAALGANVLAIKIDGGAN